MSLIVYMLTNLLNYVILSNFAWMILYWKKNNNPHFFKRCFSSSWTIKAIMSAPPSKRRRVELNLKDRINLIKDSEYLNQYLWWVFWLNWTLWNHHNCITFRECFFKEFAYEKYYLKEIKQGLIKQGLTYWFHNEII